MTKLVSGRLKAQAPTGLHPGPELLAAFAENALPEADRGQLLQHLGACSDCREILYLALPDSPELQKVLVLQPRPFRRWALGWGALVASVAIVAVLFTTNRLGYRNQAAEKVVTLPAAGTQTKIAAEKTPPELNQLQAARDALKPKMALTQGRSENKPQPESKHMTAKMQPGLVFDKSGEVHVQVPASSANAVAEPVSKDTDEKRNEQPEVAAIHGAITQTDSAGKLGDLAYATGPPAKARADQQAATGQSSALSADKVSELKSLQVEARNAPSPAPLVWKSNAKGNLGGIVSDPSGAAVANAKVTVVGPIGTQTVTSDPEGKFAFGQLPLGFYAIKAEASGFKTKEMKQVAVLDDKASALRLTLDVGNVSETVEVSGAMLEASTGYVGGQAEAEAKLRRKKTAAANSWQQGIGAGTGVPILQWTLSPEGAVQRSVDSGKTWLPVAVARGATFRALSAVNANIWVGGKAGALYHSADSGQTWTRCEPAAAGKKLDQDVVRVDFLDALHGTVNTANGEVWTTSDGGQNWQRK